VKKIPPFHVVSELKSYDPELRIRWSREKGSWAIERKVHNSKLLSKPVKWKRGSNGQWKWERLPEYSEKYIQFHDGYTPILYAHFLDRRLFLALFKLDGWKYGFKGKNYVRDNAYKEEKQEEKKESKEREIIEDTGKDALGFMRWKSGERMSLNGINSGNNAH